MDAVTFRWVLVIIALLVALAIYFYGQHQARLRRRSAIDSFTRDEIDSAFGEDEQLRGELDNLNQILLDNEHDDEIDDIVINPESEPQQTPFALPDPELHIHVMVAARDPARLINYHLRHDDFRMINGLEIEAAVQQAGLELNAQGLLEYRQADAATFQIASLSAPGEFTGFDELDFKTLGCNCFIDLDACEDPRAAYEALLKKVDELVRILNVKVYKSNQELLTVSDVTETRKTLA
jgi:FtsZ-interacting cell division protein ZipA